MTPEIVWTDAGPDQYTADYAGREWALLRRLKQPNGNPAGWYLHATEARGVLADDGRYMAYRAETAQHLAAQTILTAEVKRLQTERDKARALAGVRGDLLDETHRKLERAQAAGRELQEELATVLRARAVEAGEYR